MLAGFQFEGSLNLDPILGKQRVDKNNIPVSIDSQSPGVSETFRSNVCISLNNGRALMWSVLIQVASYAGQGRRAWERDDVEKVKIRLDKGWLNLASLWRQI